MHIESRCKRCLCVVYHVYMEQTYITFRRAPFGKGKSSSWVDLKSYNAIASMFPIYGVRANVRPLLVKRQLYSYM